VFHDNKDVIELLDKPPTGIFKLLDESCTVKSTDESLLQKIKHCHKTNPLIQNPKMPSNPTFIIVHTAKDVEYTIHGFRDKNKDELSVLTQQKMQLSKNDLLRTLFV
jgi:myosin heavy subunit